MLTNKFTHYRCYFDISVREQKKTDPLHAGWSEWLWAESVFQSILLSSTVLFTPANYYHETTRLLM